MHGAAQTIIPSIVPQSKRCPRCVHALPLAAFGSRVVNGKRYPAPYCRDCRVAYERDKYRTDPNLRARVADRDKRTRERYRDRVGARRAAQNAVRTGRLTPMPCEIGAECRGKVQAHHEDYGRPLDVRWLCQRHHREADMAMQHRRGAA